MQIGLGGLSAVADTLKENKTPKPEEIIPILVGVFGFVFGIYLLIIVVALVLGTLTAFVYPLIVDRKLGAIDALKLSVRAVMGNFFGVLSLMILSQLIILAGLMFFYVGALFVAPVIFAAWAIAYRRVFPLQAATQPNAQFGAAAQQYSWTPPVSASKAGWVLTFGALAVIGLGATALAAVGYFAYHGITNAIQKVQEERERREISSSTPPETYPTPPVNWYPTPAPNNSSNLKTISGGVLNGKATSLPKPAYPQAARAVRAGGAVNVQVVVDESGNVASASAASGHPLLRAAAEQAARSAKFTPTMLSGKAVKVTGVLVYNFAPE
jgi:TonB family protein